MVGYKWKKLFGSNNKSCSECLKSTKDDMTHYFHSGTVISTIGVGPKPFIEHMI